MMLAAALLAAGALPSADLEEDLARSVLAFGERCLSCHGESAAKGGLRLHSAAGWLDAVEPGSTEDSELLYRLTLPADDGEAMPPEGPRLGADDVDAIRAWVLAGADAEVLEGAMARAARAGADAERRAAALKRVAADTGARVAAVGDLGITVSWSHMPAPPTAAGLIALGPVADQVVELRLAGTRFDPAILGVLPELPRLVSARLERTPADDAAVLALLSKAPALAELNLHSTRISTRLADLGKRHPRLVRLTLHGTAAAPPAPDPFAAVPTIQPRRLLVGSARTRRVALMRETAIGHPVVLWEREVPALHGLQWLGDGAGGHGRVRIHGSLTGYIDVDTASGEVVGSGEGDAVVPGSSQRLRNGHVVSVRTGPGRDEPHAVERDPDGDDVLWRFRDAERFGDGPVLLFVIERTP